MNDTVSRLTNIIADFDARVQAAPPGSWSNASPCGAWTARDVVAHIIGNARGMTAQITGSEKIELTADEDVVAAWNSTRDGLLHAVNTGDLSKEVAGPFGPMPAEQVIGRLMCTDMLVHTWDLARAVGGDERLNAEAVTGAYSGLKPMDAMIRRPGAFGAKLEVPDGADEQTEFLLFLGRQV
jgi:uncharacterized protein (TIGR03086 family)